MSFSVYFIFKYIYIYIYIHIHIHIHISPRSLLLVRGGGRDPRFCRHSALHNLGLKSIWCWGRSHSGVPGIVRRCHSTIKIIWNLFFILHLHIKLLRCFNSNLIKNAVNKQTEGGRLWLIQFKVLISFSNFIFHVVFMLWESPHTWRCQNT